MSGRSCTSRSRSTTVTARGASTRKPSAGRSWRCPRWATRSSMTGPSNDSGPTEAGFINGGMLSREQAATSGPVPSSTSRASRPRWRRSAGLGGSTLVGKTPVGDMGFAAYFKDTEGNASDSGRPCPRAERRPGSAWGSWLTVDGEPGPPMIRSLIIIALGSRHGRDRVPHRRRAQRAPPGHAPRPARPDHHRARARPARGRARRPPGPAGAERLPARRHGGRRWPTPPAGWPPARCCPRARPVSPRSS